MSTRPSINPDAENSTACSAESSTGQGAHHGTCHSAHHNTPHGWYRSGGVYRARPFPPAGQASRRPPVAIDKAPGSTSAAAPRPVTTASPAPRRVPSQRPYSPAPGP
jgi:hypothetical protein